MRTIITFPDGEKLLIKVIKDALSYMGETDVRVATKKLSAQQTPTVSKQIIVRSDGGPTINKVSKEEEFGINVYVNYTNSNLGYEEANRLSNLITVLLPATPEQFGNLPLKYVEIQGVTPEETESTNEHQRYIRITTIIKGSNLSI